jgi:glycosyltransferase involved in cell wall biosynthesis
MRLLIASDHYPPFIGGAHRWAELLAFGLARRGHKVVVATVWHGGLPRTESRGDVVVHRVRQLRTALPQLVRNSEQRHQAPFPDPVTIRDLRRIIAETEPEVVLAHGWMASSAAIAIGGKDIPLLLSAHDYGYFCATRILLYEGKRCTGPAPLKCLSCAGNYYGAPKGWIAAASVAASRRVVARKLAGVQSVSAFVDEVTARHLLGQEEQGPIARSVPRFVIPAFPDVDPPGTGASEREVQALVARLPDEPFILFVGALRPIKGIEVLFEAYRRLEAPPPLVLFGTFERDTPKRFPTETIVFSNVPHKAVMAAWDRALFGVAPSVWPEPLGTVTVEAISRGKPVIATVPSGMADVLGNGAGMLVPQGDAAALAEAMRVLIEEPERRASIARAASANAVNFEAELVLSRYEEALRQLAERRGAQSAAHRRRRSSESGK